MKKMNRKRCKYQKVKSKRLKFKEISLSRIVLYVIITTIIVSAATAARYTSTIAKESGSKVAVPVIEYSSNDVLSVKMNGTALLNEQEFRFAVSNEETEVSKEYTIQIKTLNNLPLEFELYKEDENKNIIQVPLNGTTTDKIQISVSNKTAQMYLLKIRWNEKQEYKNYQFANVADYVQIIINWEQIN